MTLRDKLHEKLDSVTAPYGTKMRVRGEGLWLLIVDITKTIKIVSFLVRSFTC